jgi:hypothetical protein
MTNSRDVQFEGYSDENVPRPGQARGHRELFGGFTLGRIFGVEIAVDWSLLIIFVLVASNRGAVLFPRWHPDWSAVLLWGTALGAAFLFFISILVHEMSHALGRVPELRDPARKRARARENAASGGAILSHG